VPEDQWPLAESKVEILIAVGVDYAAAIAAGVE